MIMSLVDKSVQDLILTSMTFSEIINLLTGCHRTGVMGGMRGRLFSCVRSIPPKTGATLTVDRYTAGM